MTCLHCGKRIRQRVPRFCSEAHELEWWAERCSLAGRPPPALALLDEADKVIEAARRLVDDALGWGSLRSDLRTAIREYDRKRLGGRKERKP